jgi:hypothetical protein
MVRRLSWRYAAHRAGLVLSPSLNGLGVPFSNRWHRARIRARRDALDAERAATLREVADLIAANVTCACPVCRARRDMAAMIRARANRLDPKEPTT